MKIGLVCPYNWFMPGGVQNLVEGQARELSAKGHEVRIITPRPRGYHGPEPAGVIFVGQSARIKAQHTSVDVSVSVDVDVIDSLLGRERFDLLHVHEPLIPVLALQLLARADCPAIGTFHAALPDTLLAKSIAGSIGPYKRSVFKHLQEITVVSRAATSYIANEIDMSRVHMIPNAVKVEQFAEAAKRHRDEDMILYVGRLEKRKGVRYLLKAFGELTARRPQLRLVIAGDGPERNMLESKAHQWKLRQVEFLGQVAEDEKLRLLGSCGLFTSPALYGESFGIVLLEGMSAGAVTVAGINPGYESVLTGTGRLSLVDPRNSAEYARRMELLLTDGPLRTAWQRWAAKEVKRYSYGAVMEQYEQLYHQLAAQPR